MTTQTLLLDGREYVVVSKSDWQRLAGDSAVAVDDSDLPALPPVNERGNRDAVAYARISIARSIIRDRRAAGLSQQELAKLARVRQETISRIETGKVSATRRTVEKLEAAMKKATARR